MNAPVVIDELIIPESVDSPAAIDFRAAVDVRNAVERHVLGKSATTTTPEELLADLLDQQYERKQIFVTKRDGKIVATSMLVWSTEPETRITWIDAGVHPAWRNLGIGTALLDHAEGLARESGRPIAQGGAAHLPLETGPRLDSPTGFGSLPRDEPGVRFLLSRGYALEQVYRVSFLHLPVDEATLETRFAAAQERAGNNYRVHTWVRHTPERWRDDVAVIFARMSTDAPSGNLEIDEEPWDADRVRQTDERRIRAGRTSLVAAVEHVPSGRLVAYNGLSAAADRSQPVHQGVTLVLKEHRGHRLGMVVKIANIRQLMDVSPDSPFIVTDNAEENRPMLDVNEAVGFVPAGYVGAWKKTIA